MKINSILITQSQLKNYSGSEIVTLELAEHYASRGVKVTILTQYLDYPIKGDFDKIEGIKILVTGSKEAENIDITSYDLVWIHHLTITAKLTEQLSVSETGKPYVVFNHMSSVDMLEYPLLSDAEFEFADAILFNSEETRKNLEEKGASFSAEKTRIFANPSPDKYLDLNVINATEKSKDKVKIGIISNHPPRELREAASLLRRQKITVEFIGRSDRSRVERVTPETLSQYDTVVSIGKTVQYCITANIPIFCYDRFGGPGFITEDNYQQCRQRNFSGRGFDRMSKEELVKNLSTPYKKIKKEFNKVHELYGRDFLLSVELEKLTSSLAKQAKVRRNISVKSKSSLMYHSAKMNKFFPAYLMYMNELKDLKEEYEKLRRENDIINETLSREKITNKIKLKAKRVVHVAKVIIRNPKHASKKVMQILSPLTFQHVEQIRRRTLKSIEAYATIFHITDTNLNKLDYSDLIKELSDLNTSKLDWGETTKEQKNKIKNTNLVSIVMLVYKNIDMTKRAIEAVMNVKTGVNFELIVVDNGSDRATLRGLKAMKQKYPSLKLICNDQNLNFSLGNNVGFMHAQGGISLFLNNDTEVTDYWLEGIVESFKNPDIKVVQPTLLYPDNTVQCIGIVFSKKSDIGYGLYVGADASDKIKVKSRRLQAVTGACMAIRSDDFARLKGFDPIYVNGQEDIDLCLRLADSHHNPAYCTAASIVYHFEGKSQGRGKRVMLNREQLLKKWEGKIVPDDEPIYESDGFIVDAWDSEFKQNTKSGVEVYTPKLKKASVK